MDECKPLVVGSGASRTLRASDLSEGGATDGATAAGAGAAVAVDDKLPPAALVASTLDPATGRADPPPTPPPQDHQSTQELKSKSLQFL